MKPEQAASTLNAGQLLMPSLSCTRQATFGKIKSGVVVPTTTKSISFGVTPALSSAARAALCARWLVYSSSAAMCRRSIPVRLLIHSSVVSTIFSRSAFVRTRSGRYLPVPAIREYILMRPILDELADLEWNALARFDNRRLDGVLERELVRRAVALQHDAVEPNKARSIVTTRVQPATQRLESRPCDEALHTTQQAAAKLLLQEGAHEPSDTLHRLQRDVADEPVADDDVDVGVEDPVALDETDVVQPAAGEQLAGLTHGLVALDVLDADVQEADARPRDLQHVLGDDGPHQRELQQVLGRAADVRAEIEHVGRTRDSRHGGNDRRPIDTRQRLQYIARRRHQCAGVAGAHAGVGLSALHELDSHAQR